MQLCEDTLHDWLQQRNADSALGPQLTHPQYRVAMELFRQMCAGVEYIHAQGILHRDLKVHR